MSSNNINNFGANQPPLKADLNTGLNSDRTSDIQHASNASLSQLQKQVIAGTPIDWFGDLNSGKSLPIQARDYYSSDTPIDTIVGDIMGHLGLTKLV